MAGEIKLAQVGFSPVVPVSRLGVHYYRFAAAANVGDNVTATDGVSPETWTASAGGAGAWDFDQSGGTAASCATSLAAKINAKAASLMRAIVLGDTTVCFAKTLAYGNLTITENTAGARIVVSAAAGTGSASRSLAGNYSVTAVDVTSMAPGGANQEIIIAAFSTTTAPTLGPVAYRDVNGAVKVFAAAYPSARLLQQGANEWTLLLKENVGASLANTNVVSFMVLT